MGIIFLKVPDLWGVVLDTEWHNPVSPRTRVTPPRDSNVSWLSRESHANHNIQISMTLQDIFTILGHQVD